MDNKRRFSDWIYIYIWNKKKLLKRNQTKYTEGVLSEKNSQFKLKFSNISKREKQEGELNATLQSNKIQKKRH